MTRTLQICLMVLTAALCGVCLWQWRRESRMAAQSARLGDQLAEVRGTLASQEAKLVIREQEITRLTEALAGQSEAVRQLHQAEAGAAGARQQLEALQAATTQHQRALESLNSQLKQALDERDALALQLNDRTKAFNALAEKYRKGQ